MKISATDTGGSGLDKMQFSNDNKTWSNPIPYAEQASWRLQEGKDGNRYAYARFIDKSGNISSAVNDTITLDITKPTGTIKINNGAASTNKRDVVLYLSATDSYSGINTTYGKMSFSNDGINYTTEEPYNTKKAWQLSEGGGTKTVYVKLKDRAENWSAPFSDTIEYISPDNIPPQGTITINNNSRYTNSQNVTLTPYAEDNPGGSGLNTMSFSNDGINYNQPQAYSANPVSWLLAQGDGEKTVYVKYTDKEANTSAAFTDTIILDTTAPQIDFENLQNNMRLSGDIAVHVLLNDANKDYVEFYLNDILQHTDPEGTGGLYRWPWTTTNFNNGAYTLRVIGYDKAGNFSLREINITIDNRDPLTKSYAFLYKQMDKYKQADALRLIESYSAPYPPGQQYTAWIYDNALAVMAFLARKQQQDLQRAKLLVKSLIWAQENDPVFNDGRLRDACWANNLQNPDGASIKEPGSGLGNLSWVILAFLDYYQNAGDSDQLFLNKVLNSAKKIADFIIENYADPDHPGFRTGFYGWGGTDIHTFKSTENHTAFYPAVICLYELTSDIKYLKAAESARAFMEHLYNSTNNMFYTGTENDGWTPLMGYSEQVLDCQTLTTLATGQYVRYPVRRWLESNCATTIDGFDGFDFNTDKDGIWFEGTAQAALLYRLLSDNTSYQRYITEIETAQTDAQNADGESIVAASRNGLTTGFSYNYYVSPSLAATCWYILAKQGKNPLWSHPVTNIRPVASITTNTQNPAAEEEIAFSSADSYDQDGNIASYHWDFGDNTGSNQLSPTHVYSQAGTYKIVLTVTDNDGLKGYALTVLEVSEADHTPPTGYISISNGAQYTNSASVTLNLTAQDNPGGSGLDKMQFSNNGSNWSAQEPYATTKTYNLSSGDGEKTVYVKFTDKKGNTSIAYSDTIILDTTPPDILILSPMNGSIVNTPTVTLQGTVDGVPFSESRSLTESQNTITKTATDNAGNSVSKSITVILDTQPPTNPSVIINNNAVYTNSRNISLTLSATGASHMMISESSDFTVPVGGAGGGFSLFAPASWEPYSQTKSLTLSSGDGTKAVYAKFKDVAGNESSAVSDSIILDTTPPVIVITSPQDNAIVNTPTITLQGTIDGVPFSESRTLTEGTNTLTKTATDAAGNSASASITVTLDTAPPNIVITQPANGVTLNTPTITLEGTIDGASFSESRTLQEVGKNIITKEATDLAGNKGSASIIVIYAPGELIGPQGGEVVSFDGRIRLIIPPGALSEPTYVSISSLDPTIFERKMPNDYSSIVVVKCEPMGLVLLKEAQLIIKLDSQQVPGTEIELGLYNYGLDEVELLGQLCPVASDGFTVNFTLWHFSEYLGLRNMVSQGAPIGAGVQVPLPDLLTGSYSYEVPITVPPGRAKMQPSISLSYNSSNSNSWVGFGWNLNPGYIMRSTKRGIPSYNDTKDTFILVSGNSSTELIHLVDNLYQARVESDFTKFFKEADDSWKIIQKDGTVLRFGTSPDSKETSQYGTFSWHLTKVIDNNGNYISLSYAKDEGKSYLSRIEYTGNENTYFAPTHSVNFYLEDRNDAISSYISGSKILMKKRLRTIEVLAGYALIWRYELDYEYAPETNRSLLKSVCKYTSDSKPFPEQRFYYQNHNGELQ